MRITPLDVRKQEFRRSVRGLDPDEVHAFLATVADEYEAVLTDNKQLREKVIELDEKVAEYRNMERTLRDTLLTAERVMTEARQNARKEAELIMRDAQVKAHEATASIQNQVDALRGQMRELRGQRDAFLARLQSLAEAQIGLAESYRKDFQSDDERIERLMRDPDRREIAAPSEAPEAAAEEPMAPAESTTADGPPATPGFSAAAFAPEPDHAGTEAPEPPSRPASSAPEVDEWRGYDVQIGAAPKAPPAGPVETNVDESTAPANAPGGPTGPQPPTDPDDDRTPTAENAHTVEDEVTDAVDAVLGPVSGLGLDPHAAADSGAAPEETPASPSSPEATPREWAGAAGAPPAGAADTEPDAGEREHVSGPTSPPSNDPDDPEAGRWSLSRFTRGLSNF